jgi:hypothetical protein
MAVDRKGDYVGNHGGHYTDIDGQSKMFTYIDHDRHTSRTQSGRESDEVKERKAKELEELRASIKKINDDKISAILAMPPYDMGIGETDFVKKVLYTNLILRDPPRWEENMVREICTIDKDLCTRLFNETWRNTVKEEYWQEDMSYEDIIAGKWKELI